MEDAELDPVRERSQRIGADLGGQPRQVDVGRDMDVEDGKNATSAGTPESDSGPRPEMLPAPDSPPLSVQLPSPLVPSDGVRIWSPPLLKRAKRLRFQGRPGPCTRSYRGGSCMISVRNEVLGRRSRRKS